MTKLTDLQLVLLSTAAARDDGNLMPPADSVAARASGIRQAVASLIKRDLAEARPVANAEVAYCDEGGSLYGAFITDAGRQAIGAPAQSAAAAHAVDAVPVAGDSAAKPQTKQALLVSMLQRNGGASLDELVAATSWLRHTTRAAMTGLRKKGHAIAKTKVERVTRYSIAVAA